MIDPINNSVRSNNDFGQSCPLIFRNNAAYLGEALELIGFRDQAKSERLGALTAVA